METKQLHAAALARGAHPQALTDIAALATVHFGEDAPKPADLDAWLATLDVWTLRGIDYEVFAALHPVEQMRLEREFKPQPPAPVHARRPVMRDLTPAELTQLQSEGLDRHTYTERARTLQQTPAPRPEAAPPEP